MNNNSFSDLFRRYAAVIWHWAWLLVIVTVVAAGVTYITSKQITPVYQATTTILINEAPSTRSVDYTSVLLSERLAATYSQMITTDTVMDGVISRLGLTNITAPQLAGKLTVRPVTNTTLMQVSVQDEDRFQAAAIANATVEEFISYIQKLQASKYASSKVSLETQLAQLDVQIQETSTALADIARGAGNPENESRLQSNLASYRTAYATLLQSYEQIRLAEAQSTSTLLHIEKAVAPLHPIRPRVTMYTLMGALIGFALAGGIIILIEALDDTLRDPNDVFPLLGVSILGMISKFDTQQGNIITATQPRSPVSEAFRTVRTNIQYASVDKPVRKLLVTSPSPSDGKSTIAVNLASVIAQSGRKVALIDCDMRRPCVHKIMQVANRRGLSDLFVQPTVNLEGILQTTNIPNLFVLPSGPTTPNPSELLNSEKMGEIFDALHQVVDLIVIDSPPILAVTDASILARKVDGLVLIVKPGTTKVAACSQALEQMRRIEANIFGVVLNAVELNRSRYYYYYHYKGYYYTYYSHYAERSGSNGNKNNRVGEAVEKPAKKAVE